jgi:hypothetical protein
MKVRYHKPIISESTPIIDQFNYALTLLDKYKAIVIIYKDGDIEELKKDKKLSDLEEWKPLKWHEDILICLLPSTLELVHVSPASKLCIYLIHESTKLDSFESCKNIEIPVIELVNRLEWIEDKVKKTAYSTYLPYIKISNLNG